MNFKFFHGGTPVFNKRDFDTKDYECVNMYYTKKDLPVALSKHKTRNVWKVQYGFSTLIFDSYTEAIAYCESHFSNNRSNCDKRKGV